MSGRMIAQAVLILAILVGLGMTMSRTEFGYMRGFQDDNAIGSTANSLRRLESLPTNIAGAAIAVVAAILLAATMKQAPVKNDSITRLGKTDDGVAMPAPPPGPLAQTAGSVARAAGRVVGSIKK